MRLEAITFDLWNTLVHNRNYEEFRLPALDSILRSYGVYVNNHVLREAYIAGFRYSSDTIPLEGYRHIETWEIVDKVLDSVEYYSIEARDEIVLMYENAILSDPPKLKEGVFEALEFVQEKYKIGLISVTGVSLGKIIRNILRDYKIIDYFDVLTFSDEVKYVKPNPLLFKTCIEELEVKPEKTIHVGDSFKSDIVGAIDSGMKTIWIKTQEQEQKENYVPDVIIHSLLELPKALIALE
jgi:HAD superfamily hydrolase (TIGR01509 family)